MKIILYLLLSTGSLFCADGGVNYSVLSKVDYMCLGCGRAFDGNQELDVHENRCAMMQKAVVLPVPEDLDVLKNLPQVPSALNPFGDGR